MPVRERTYRTEAIVLRRKDFGEADRVLTVLTPHLGKVRAVAKGIRKPRSRKAGHLELYTCVALLMHKGRDLDMITQAETIEAFRPVRDNLWRSASATYTVELLDKLTPDGEENPEMYHLLRQALAWVATSENLPQTLRYYELHVMSLAGYQPELFRCVVCGKKIVAENQYFSAAAGGAVCAQCGPTQPGAWAVSINALKYLRYFQAQPYAHALTARVPAPTLTEMENLLARYITHVLERQLKSVEFLKLIRRDG